MPRASFGDAPHGIRWKRALVLAAFGLLACFLVIELSVRGLMRVPFYWGEADITDPALGNIRRPEIAHPHHVEQDVEEVSVKPARAQHRPPAAEAEHRNRAARAEEQERLLTGRENREPGSNRLQGGARKKQRHQVQNR